MALDAQQTQSGRQMATCAKFLSAVILFSGATICGGTHAQSMQVRLITSLLTDKCALTEVVINDVLVGHAFRSQGSRLQDLDGSSFSGFAQYFPPDHLVVRRDGEIDGLKILVTTEKTENSAKAVSEAYRAVDGKGLAYDLALVPSASPLACSSGVSAVSSLSGPYKTSAFFEQLYKNTPRDPIGSFTRRIDVSLERPDATEFALEGHVFRRVGSEWREERNGTLVATYDEFNRNLAGFDLRDRKKVKHDTPFGPTESTRIVHAPSGFRFWLPGRERKQFKEYRPNDFDILEAPRRDLRPIQVLSVVTKSFIRKIMTDPIVDGQPIPPTSAERLGFSDLVGGRSQALAFALLTDELFSEEPISDGLEAADFRLLSMLKLTARCQDNWIQTYTVAPLRAKFGNEGPLESEGKISIQPKLREQKTEGRIESLRINYEVTGRPHAAALPSFNLIRPRSCSWIWHAVEAEVSCRGGQLMASAKTTGSQFPSRKIWINSTLAEDVEQSAFDRLWICNSSDQTRVE